MALADHYEDSADAAQILNDLEFSALGSMLTNVVSLARQIDDRRAKADPMNRFSRPSPVETLAGHLLDVVGEETLSEIASKIAER